MNNHPPSSLPQPPHQQQQHQQQQQQQPSPLPPHRSFLLDLIHTEKSFINDLFTIINRIASVYTPSNLPPTHLDHHFRLIESIFRSHKSFLSHSVLPIDPPPVNCHLNDLINLISSLVHHILPVYHHRYCHPQGWAGAGGWSKDPAIISNDALTHILLSIDWPPSAPLPSPTTDTPSDCSHSIFPDAPYRLEDMIIYRPNRESSSSSPLLSSSSPSSSSSPHATLTVYFALPFIRLIYYRRFTHSLLQLLQPGSPDHKQIYDTAHQISILLDRGRSQWSIPPLPNSIRSTGTANTGSSSKNSSRHNTPSTHSIELPRQNSFTNHHHQPNSSSSTHSSPSKHFSPIHAASPQAFNTSQSPISSNLRASTETTFSGLGNSSTASISDEVFDQTNPSTPLSSSSATFDAQQQASCHGNEMVQVKPNVFIQQAILDLQAQLDTRRCLDLFTMTPKQCRLYLAPPTLNHSRLIKYQGDAQFKLLPQSDPSREIETSSGRLILITDLLMFCEYKDSSTASKHPQMWLMYPPLSGRHLQVSPPINEPHVFAFDVIAMGKEVIRVLVSNPAERDNWIQHLQEAIAYSRQVALSKATSSISSEGRSQSPNDEIRRAPKPQLAALSINVVPPKSGAKSQPTSPRVFQSTDRSHSPLPNLDSHPSRCSPPAHSDSIPGPSEPASSSHPSVARHQLFDDSRPPINRAVSSSQLPEHHQHQQPRPPAHAWTAQPAEASALQEPHSSFSGRGVSGSRVEHSTNEGGSPGRSLRKAPSAHALGALYQPHPMDRPPMPRPPDGMGLLAADDPRFGGMMPTRLDPNLIPRPMSTEPYADRHYRPPSLAISQAHDRSTPRFRDRSPSKLRHESEVGPQLEDDDEDSIPAESPCEPTKSIIAATMKTKIFLKQSHSQWKSIGAAKLTVFIQKPGNTKQLVVNDSKGRTLISTIVLTDGVERVGRTGVAVDLSDRGVRTGIVYMLQLKNETLASQLFEQLLEGSDRRPKQPIK